jgi:transposase
MRHCGMDVHLRSITVETLDPETGEVCRRVLRTEKEALRRWLSAEVPMRVVLEAGTSSHWVAETVEELGHEVVVVDPRRTSAVAVAGGSKKTDALDASTLAWLSSKGALVPSYRSSPAMREWRRLLTTRQRMVRSRGDLTRTVRSALAAQGIVLPVRRAGTFVDRVRQFPEGLPLAGLLELIEAFDQQLAAANSAVLVRAHSDPVVRRLMTVDGVGPLVGSAFRVVVEDPHRFRSGRQVAAYVGLTPAVHNSGNRERLGRISKRGDKLLRTLLVEAALVILNRTRKRSRLQEWGRELRARVGQRKAAVAVARKLCAVMWAMWKRETDFERTT